jgi:hypothetical protein
MDKKVQENKQEEAQNNKQEEVKDAVKENNKMEKIYSQQKRSLKKVDDIY